MKKRKAIAVIVGFAQCYFNNRALQGIIKQAKKLDYDVAIFSVFTLADEKSGHQIGEENIYNLLSSKRFDGYIIVGYSFWAMRSKEEIYSRINSLTDNCAVIIDDRDQHGIKGIMADDIESVEYITSHLIEKHGKKKIYCLTGTQGYIASENRITGYKNAMDKHGLYYNDSYIFYGDYSTGVAEVIAKDIAQGCIERPEAVVCGNDIMAITLANTLIDLGIRVPEDIAVTGYDLVKDALDNTPSITTCSRPDIYVGAQCVCYLHEKITGEKITPDFGETIGSFVSGESCGCRTDSKYAHEYDEVEREYERYYSLYLGGSMQEKLMASKSFNEFIDNLSQNVYLIRGCKRYSLCLNDGWDEFEENDDKYIKEGYSEKVTEVIGWHGYSDIEQGSRFPSDEVFPPLMLEEESPVACYFSPVHFEDRCFGYEVIKFLSDEITPDNILHLWTRGINVALEYVRVHERMQIMYNKVFACSIRDGMTGLYNRRGYELYCTEAFRNAKQKQLKLLIAVADLDNLKYINDTFGHSEGDNALTTLAQALQTCCGNSEYCVRTGGDEFAIVGCYDYDEQTPIYYKSRIEGYLSRYNNVSDKPYNVEASTGFFLGFIDDFETIEQCQEIADMNMYENKKKRKIKRGQALPKKGTD